MSEVKPKVSKILQICSVFIMWRIQKFIMHLIILLAGNYPAFANKYPMAVFVPLLITNAYLSFVIGILLYFVDFSIWLTVIPYSLLLIVPVIFNEVVSSKISWEWEMFNWLKVILKIFSLYLGLIYAKQLKIRNTDNLNAERAIIPIVSIFYIAMFWALLLFVFSKIK